MQKYSAILLFQFKVTVDGNSGKYRTCLEITVLIDADSAREALKIAKHKGRTRQYKYTNDEGNQVHYQFVGVMELLHLGIECEDDEVWYNSKTMLTPMERKEKLIPKEYELSAIRHES